MQAKMLCSIINTIKKSSTMHSNKALIEWMISLEQVACGLVSVIQAPDSARYLL